MNPTVREVAGEAYTLPKIIELLNDPGCNFRTLKLYPVACNGKITTLQLSRVRYACEEECQRHRSMGNMSYKSELGDLVFERLKAWPECHFGDMRTMFNRENHTAHEIVTFHVPRPEWDPQDETDWVFVNQGFREAVVLAHRLTENGPERLVEYTMPKGTTALLIQSKGGDRNVSYKNCPKEFIRQMQANGISWEGNSQTGLKPMPVAHSQRTV